MTDTIRIFESTVVFKEDVVFLKDVSVNGTLVAVSQVNAVRVVYRTRVLRTRWDLVKALFSRGRRDRDED